MAEQETSRTSHQARNNAPDRSQSEGQGSASRSRGGSGGGRRRGRGGRNRGQRQDDSAQVPEGSGNAPQTGSADTTITAQTIAAPESSGSSRGRRNRRGNRGGSRGQRNQGRGVFSMGPQRTFGGRLTTTEQPTEIAQDASLSADAPEFLPGQPVSQRSAQQQPSSASQPTGQGRARNRTRDRKQDRPRQDVPKSTASELWQRIQEDIANWNYECRICTEEVTRKTEVWSCTTCWTVVHLECAHQWWDTSMKVNEESGDQSWRCPGSTFASNSATAELAKAVPRLSGKKFRAIVARQSCILHNHAERDSHLALTSANGRLHVDILLLTISVILMMYPARHAHTSFRSDASVEKRPFTTSLVICKRLIAESNAGRNSPAGSIHVKSYVIAPENAEMLRTVASKYAENPSCYVTTHARASAMDKLPVKNQQLVSTSNPTPSRPEIRCDEECERLDRNRRLAAALNIDPASHTNDHIPFSDNTLKLYKQMQSWGDAQESQFRVFAANKDEVRLRYEPMKNQSRQFLHLLAEDFGFESKSEDYDIHRSVLVWKSDKFVSAPTKTLAQCVKIRATQAAEAAAAAAIRPPSPPILETEPFNALVLTEPRFGLTIEEVNTAVEPDLTSLQGFSFKVDFLNEEVLIKASVSYSAFLTPAPMEKSLEILKPRIEQTNRREKLAGSVLLCHSDATGAISRREVPLRTGTGGWSAIAGRAASRPMSSSSTPAPEEAKPGRKLLLGLKKKRPQQSEAGKVWAALDGDVEC
ncbi:cysteine-rich NFX-1 [Fusarium agapanthi]|uniref:Cysteine-rich NFX-1 n=1 Tax=Fusarium agapanthi TaxID=1803897 RepID=A0A9P5BFZ5_9HYPO|nr:cysteine-rich NFX-1 [Fusarium agapanthi]